jgi:DNA polymerase-3 subunit epsilon
VVQKVLSKCDGYLWHNGDEFDGPFLEMELKRVGLEMPKRPSIDTMTKGVWATPDGKKPRLSELCFACGVPYDPTLAHAAAYDVDRMIECYDKGKAWGFYPADFAQETAQGS